MSDHWCMLGRKKQSSWQSNQMCRVLINIICCTVLSNQILLAPPSTTPLQETMVRTKDDPEKINAKLHAQVNCTMVDGVILPCQTKTKDGVDVTVFDPLNPPRERYYVCGRCHKVFNASSFRRHVNRNDASFCGMVKLKEVSEANLGDEIETCGEEEQNKKIKNESEGKDESEDEDEREDESGKGNQMEEEVRTRKSSRDRHLSKDKDKSKVVRKSPRIIVVASV